MLVVRGRRKYVSACRNPCQANFLKCGQRFIQRVCRACLFFRFKNHVGNVEGVCPGIQGQFNFKKIYELPNANHKNFRIQCWTGNDHKEVKGKVMCKTCSKGFDQRGFLFFFGLFPFPCLPKLKQGAAKRRAPGRDL